MYGCVQLAMDSEILLSNVTAILTPYHGAPEAKLWSRQQSSIRVVWTRTLGQNDVEGSEPAIVRWRSLSWHMFPFGEMILELELSCCSSARCTSRCPVPQPLPVSVAQLFHT